MADATISGGGQIVNDATLSLTGGAFQHRQHRHHRQQQCAGVGRLTFGGAVQQAGAVDIDAGRTAQFRAGFGLRASGREWRHGLRRRPGDRRPVAGRDGGGLLAGGLVRPTRTLDWTGGSVAGTVQLNSGGNVSGAW